MCGIDALEYCAALHLSLDERLSLPACEATLQQAQLQPFVISEKLLQTVVRRVGDLSVQILQDHVTTSVDMTALFADRCNKTTRKMTFAQKLIHAVPSELKYKPVAEAARCYFEACGLPDWWTLNIDLANNGQLDTCSDLEVCPSGMAQNDQRLRQSIAELFILSLDSEIREPASSTRHTLDTCIKQLKSAPMSACTSKASSIPVSLLFGNAATSAVP